MAGASDAHVTIAGNIFALLRNHVRGSNCRVYISDMKVRLESLDRFYYPDIPFSPRNVKVNTDFSDYDRTFEIDF